MITVRPFSSDHVDDAARLFCARYTELRSSLELLPSQFGDAIVIREMLSRIIKDNPGYIALEGSTMVGYMAGYAGIPEFKGSAHGVYVPAWGHALAESSSIDAVYEALYFELARDWVNARCTSQAVSYFNPNVGLERFLFGLGFGLMVIDGIRSLKSVDVLPNDECEIRSATIEDVEEIAILDGALGNHLRSSPVYLHTSPVDVDTIVEHFLPDDGRTFLAWQGDKAIGGIRAMLNSGPGCDLFNVGGSLGINFAYTDQAQRRSGIATQLLNEALSWGESEGMVRCVVDFESANLAARGFWETHFHPVCHSVFRRVDERM